MSAFLDKKATVRTMPTIEDERAARYRFCDSIIDSIQRDCGDYLSYGECADLAHEIWADLPQSDRQKYFILDRACTRQPDEQRLFSCNALFCDEIVLK